jgi:curved DNA-binding protein CbpA
VRSSATTDEIAAAYRAKARLHHPDVSSAGDAERRMADVNSAWSVLRDPTRRAAWDRANELEAQAPSTPRPPVRANGAAPASASAGTRPGTVAWRRGPAGEGAAGPPPGGARGSVLPFGRHIGWSLGEVARVDPGYLVWLQARREGAPYLEEIERFLATIGATRSTPERAGRARRGVFR